MTGPTRGSRRPHILSAVLLSVCAVAAIIAAGFLNAGGEQAEIAAAPPTASASPRARVTDAATPPPAAGPVLGPQVPQPGKRTTTEVQPGAGGGPHQLGAPASALFTGPIPRSGSAVGSLVAGFPSVIPVTQGSVISSSSVSSSGGIVQVTLVARTTISAPDVLGFYSSQFGKVGIVPQSPPTVAGSVAYSFTRGNDSVTVTATPVSGGGSRYSVVGVLDSKS
jgi:hypothetical protein